MTALLIKAGANVNVVDKVRACSAGIGEGGGGAGAVVYTALRGSFMHDK